jgi:hypothetical protein
MKNEINNQSNKNRDGIIPWCFPTINGVRTKESQALLDQKHHTKTSPDLSDIEDAPL